LKDKNFIEESDPKESGKESDIESVVIERKILADRRCKKHAIYEAYNGNGRKRAKEGERGRDRADKDTIDHRTI